ncbi:hypothetical protein BL131_00022400, partial [Klebsiella pneumoniae]
GTVCVVGKIRDLILQLSKSSIYSTKPLITIKRLWFGEKFYLTGGFKIHLFQKVNFLYFS